METLSQQQEAIERLKKYKFGALFMAPGTGKTLTAYILSTSTNVEKIIWLTPCRTKENLNKEIKKYGGDERVEIFGIESISMSDRVYLELNDILEKNNCFLLIDESIKIKNFDAKRTKRLLELSKKAEYKLILNGTPITRNLLDLWSQFEFLSPKILNLSYTQFRDTFCEWEKITKWGKKGKQVMERIKKFHNLDYLYSLIDPFVYQCSLNLSVGKQFKNMTYYLSPEEEDEYERILDYFVSEEQIKFMDHKVFMMMTQKMQQSYSLSGEKITIVDDIVKIYDRSKIIIFTKYIKTRNFLQKKYPDIMILSYGMHSFGLNLQDKNVIIFFDKTFDYSQRIQSEFRTYRTGQQSDCTYYDITSNAPLDDMINKNIERKIHISESLKLIGIQSIKKKLQIKPCTTQPLIE